MNYKTILNIILRISIPILIFSGIVDLLLWHFERYYVPSYVVTFFCISSIIMIEIIRVLINESSE